MKRLILFSSPKGKNFEEILEKIFSPEIENKVLAYLPTHKKYLNQEYTDYWKRIADDHNAKFNFIEISSDNPEDQIKKVLESNIMLITGGNTFYLLYHLKKSGIYKAIKDFYKKDEFVISGWSAGALVMTPTIFVAGLPHRDGSKTPMDENKVGLTDLTGLNLVDFEIFPHYDENTQKKTLENYRKETKNEVKALTDDEFIVTDL